MKLIIYILFGIILTLQYDSADGQFKELFGSVKKVKQEVKTFFNPNDKNKQEENKDTSTNIHFVEDDVKEDVVPAKQPAQPTTAQPTTAPAPTTPQSPTNGTSEDKDGRENFSGGCLAGYMRTPDGRCKPTFG